jgi:hypothetical protein
MNTAVARVFRDPTTAGAESSATRTWTDVAFLYAGVFVVTLGALAVDERLLNGISVWIKPLKFQASLALHFATLALLARLLSSERVETRSFRATVGISTAAGLFEIAWIMLQAGRGRASHFNDETVLEQVMYLLMGAGALLLVAAPFMMGLWLWRDYRGDWRDDPLRLAAVLGLVLSAPATLVVAGYMSSVAGAHWVGNATTDAGGLPLVGWSQEVGDLRVAHFFATHGMQFLPLLGFALRRRGRAGAHAVVAATLLWLVFTAGVFLQALDGRPFLDLG